MIFQNECYNCPYKPKDQELEKAKKFWIKYGASYITECGGYYSRQAKYEFNKPAPGKCKATEKDGQNKLLIVIDKIFENLSINDK